VASSHPSYPHPTIVEALCEIHFVPDPDRQWADNNPLPLLNLLSSEFPIVDFLSEINLSVDIRDGQQNASAQATGQRLRVTNAARNRHVQVPPAGNVLVFNVQAPYPGWVAVRSDIERLWKATQSILRPTRVTRIGLRYINRLEHDGSSNLSDWIKATDKLPAALVNSKRGSRFQMETQEDAAHRSSIRVASLPGSDDESRGTILFDIDRAWQSDEGVAPEAVTTIADNLHEAVWGDFSGSITERYQTHLERGGE